jgi:hypothetical protein
MCLRDSITKKFKSTEHSLLPSRVIIVGSGERGSSVSTVSGYGLDDRAIEVQFQAEAKDYLL